MNIGKACAIFEQIESERYTDEEKLLAIREVIEMPTHNGITNTGNKTLDVAYEKVCKALDNAIEIVKKGEKSDK